MKQGLPLMEKRVLGYGRESERNETLHAESEIVNCARHSFSLSPHLVVSSFFNVFQHETLPITYPTLSLEFSKSE